MTNSQSITISANADAVDAASVTKDQALVRFAHRKCLSLSDIAAIGDGLNDLPFLELRGLLVAGCPSNAQEPVRSTISELENGYVSSSPYSKGFIDFYNYASENGAKAVVTDRDGVLIGDNGTFTDDKILQIFKRAGTDNFPEIKILTGSSVEQNLHFLADSGILAAARENISIVTDPFLILAENGNLKIDIFSRDFEIEFEESKVKSTLDILLNRFRSNLIADLERSILPKFGFKLSDNPFDQTGKVYLPPKRTMVTVNVPIQDGSGRMFRSSTKSSEFRQMIVASMQEIAIGCGLVAVAT